MYANEMIGAVCHPSVTTVTRPMVDALTTAFSQLAPTVRDRGADETPALLGR